MHTEWDKFKPAEDKGNGIRKNSSGMQKYLTLISGKEITSGWIFEIHFLCELSENIWGWSVINMASRVLGSKYVLYSSSSICFSFLSSYILHTWQFFSYINSKSEPTLEAVCLSPSLLRAHSQFVWKVKEGTLEKQLKEVMFNCWFYQLSRGYHGRIHVKLVSYWRRITKCHKT